MNVSESENLKLAKKSDNVTPRWVFVLAMVLLAGHVWLVQRQVSELSPVGPEIGHMVRGSEALLGNRDGLGRHPHPYDYVVGMQLLNAPDGAHRPVSPDSQMPIAAQLDHVVKAWVHTGLFNASDSPLFAARYTTLLMSIVLAILLFAMSRKMWGDHGGLLTLAMYCYSPAILAHAPLATPDLANALILTALAAWTWRKGIRLGKSGSPPPIWPLMLLVLVGVMQWAMASKPQPTELWASSWYLNGQVFDSHPGSFYRYTFLIKTPLATLVLLLLAQVVWILSKGQRQRDIQLSWPMLCIIVCTMYTASRVTEPTGWRLLLPMYPALFVLTGSLMRPPRKESAKQQRWIPIAQKFSLLCVTVLVMQTVLFPQQFLTFTNQAARQHDAIFPHLAVDNLDWGQDVHIAVKQSDYVAGFGAVAEADPSLGGKSLLQWSDKTLHGGRFAISSNYLSGATPKVLPRDWTPQMDQEYRRLREYFKSGLLKMPKSAGHHAHGMEALSHEQWMWLRLRLARICAHLRVRQPDQVINKTMLVYDLSDEQVQFMLDTPPFAEDSEQLDW